MKVNLDLLTEEVFKRVPGWWPRAYISLLLFKYFGEGGYVVPAYSLRKKAQEVGLGKTTLYKCLNTLIKEGLIKKEDSLYILTEDGYQVLTILNDFENELKNIYSFFIMPLIPCKVDILNILDKIKEETITKLKNLKEIIKGKGIECSFIDHAITYVEAYAETTKSLITEIVVEVIKNMIKLVETLLS